MLSMTLLNMQNLFGLKEVLNPKEKPTYAISVYVRNGANLEKGTIGIFLTDDEIARLTDLITTLSKNSSTVQARLFAQLAQRASLTLQTLYEILEKWYEEPTAIIHAYQQKLNMLDSRTLIPALQRTPETLKAGYEPIAREYIDVRGDVTHRDRTPATLAELFFPMCGEVTIYHPHIAVAVFQMPVDSQWQQPLIEWQEKIQNIVRDSQKENS